MQPPKFLPAALLWGLVLLMAAPLMAQEEPIFLLEAGGAGLPAALRTCRDPLPEAGEVPTAQGLAELLISASAQFSQAELRQMRRRLPPWLVVVDLRPLPHGFLNGLAVSWQPAPRPPDAPQDPLAWLEQEEAERLQAAQEAGRVRLAPLVAAQGQATPPVTMQVFSAQSEGQLLALTGLGYFRLPLAEATVPDDRQVEDFLRFQQALPPGTWLHFHGGPGDQRPALLWLMVDILANARQLSLEELLARQALVEGPPPGADPTTPGGLAQFLARFHAFASQTASGQPASWLAWLREQGGAPATGQPPAPDLPGDSR